MGRTPNSFTNYPWQIAAIGIATLFLGLLLADLIWIVARPLALLFLAITLGEALSPVVALLERRLPRAGAVIGVYLILLAIVGGVAWVILPAIVTQAQTFIMETPALLEQARRWIERLDAPGSDRIIPLLNARLNRFSSSLVALPFSIISAAVEVVLVIFMSLYWLLIAPELRSFTLSLVPRQHRPYASDTLEEIGQMMGGYVRGAAIQGVIIGVLTYIGLMVFGVEFAIVLAIIAGLFELIPVVGPIVAMVPIVGVAVLQSPTLGLITLGFWIVIQQIENHVLTPLIMRSQTNISPLLVIFAVFLGSDIGGLLGALVAIPLAGLTKVVVVRLVAPWIRRWAGTTASEHNESQVVEEIG